MLCRDFFLYTALKEGARVERPQGLREEEPQWAHSPEAFQRWARGATGLPFVDACMRELAATGYMSNRGRQNVSSFLCKVRLHLPLKAHPSAYAMTSGHLTLLLRIRNMLAALPSRRWTLGLDSSGSCQAGLAVESSPKAKL